MPVSPYESIAVAATFSPRFHQVLAEANRMRRRFDAPLSVIFVGEKNAANESKFREAFETLQIPTDSPIHYEAGDPATAIMAAAEKHHVDLLIAGALERASIHRLFLGDVARRLVREATFSLMLFTEPQLEPKPMRHVVFLARYSSNGRAALQRTIAFAERESTPHLHVIRIYTSFDKARAARRGSATDPEVRTLAEEESALREFVLGAGETAVPIEARCVRGNTGFSASDFVQSVGADLLVVPLENKPAPDGKLPPRIAWLSDVIPCNLWIMRPRAAAP